MASSSERRRKAILSFLGGKSEPVTASDLADQFGVSDRTIYRDFDSLRESGVSIGAQRSAGGGFHLSLPTPAIRSHATPVATGRALPISRISLIGRRAELALLEGTRERTASGVGAAVVLTGEPGIGKSRLASEFSRESEASGELVLTARCHESSGSPAYWPWISLIESAVRELQLTDLPVEREQFDRLVQVVPTLVDSDSADPRHSSWQVENPEEAEFLLNQAIARLFVELSRRTTRCVV